MRAACFSASSRAAVATLTAASALARLAAMSSVPSRIRICPARLSSPRRPRAR